MKRAHAARHRHLAASSRMDRRIERDAQGREAARRARQADRYRPAWSYGDLPLRPPVFGARLSANLAVGVAFE